MALFNIMLFSILKCIIENQDYRIVYISTTSLSIDVSSKISQLIWHHNVPVYLIDLDKKENHIRRLIEEPTLNIFVINNSSDIYKITKVKEFLQANDVTLILFNSPDSNVDDAKFQPWMKMSMKTLIICKKFLVSVNQIHVDKIEKISVQPYIEIETKQFVDNYLADNKNARGANMTIFAHHTPPKSVIGPTLSNNYTFNGPDGIVSDVLMKALNLSPMFVTDLGIKHPHFRTWKKNPGIAKRLHYYDYHKEATTSNVFSIFNVTAKSTMDFYITAGLVDINVEFNPNTETLYPHDKSCLIVVVPKRTQAQNFLTTFMRHGDIQSICYALLVFALLRIFVHRPHFAKWASVFFRTLQLFLNQGTMLDGNAFEVAWTKILRGFSVIAISTTSAILYKSLINVQPHQINTVDDLIASNFTVFIPESISEIDDITTNLELRKKFVVVRNEKFGEELFSGEFNSAYVCHEANAQFLMKMRNVLEVGHIKSHVMKEKLFCRLNSYRINKSSPFKRITNEILRRCIENGLYDKSHEWVNRLNDALYMNHNVNSKPREVVITMDVISSVFHWYVGGMFTSLVCFTLEVCITKLKRTS